MPNGSLRGMYEHVRGILKHKYRHELDKKGQLTSSQLTQFNLKIRYSIQRYDIQLKDTQLMILND